MITGQQFKTLFPRAQDPEGWATSMNDVFPTYEINTPKRIAAFLAQCGHESGGWTTFEENLNYSAQGLNGIFKKYFPTIESAQPYARKPQMIANKVYGNRMGNRDEASGDGWRFRGSGFLQLTGHSNFYHAGQALGVDFVMQPELVRTPMYAAQTAGWFWQTHKLNQYADSGDFVTMTKRINGGTIGLDDRIKHINHALEVLS